jgi:hypothetical protein
MNVIWITVQTPIAYRKSFNKLNEAGASLRVQIGAHDLSEKIAQLTSGY